MKNCPYCAEEIQDEAIVCRYCGHDTRVPVPPPSNPIPTSEPNESSAPPPTGDQNIPDKVSEYFVICPNCNTRNRVGLSTCSNCLAPLSGLKLMRQSVPVQTKIPANYSPAPSPAPPSKKTSPLTWLLVSILIVGCIISVCLLLGFPSSFRNPTTSSNYSAPDTKVYAKDFVKLVPGSMRCSSDYGYMTISGKVENTSDTYDLQYVELRGTVLKSDGTTVNTDTGYIDSDTLNRNSTSSYELMISNPNDEGNKCQIKVEDARFK